MSIPASIINGREWYLLGDKSRQTQLVGLLTSIHRQMLRSQALPMNDHFRQIISGMRWRDLRVGIFIGDRA